MINIKKIFKPGYNFLNVIIRELQWRIYRPAVPKSDLKYIHLGCGDINHPKMINVDMRYDKHIHYLHDVKSLPMFSDNFAD